MDETQTKSCPKCGKRNDHDAIECQRCGIIFEKYEEIQRRKAHGPIKQSGGTSGNGIPLINCSACGSKKSMSPTKIYKFGGIVRFIGYLIVTPSVIGIAFAAILFFSTGSVSSDVLANAQNNPEKTGAVIGAAMGFGLAGSIAIGSLISGLVGWLLIMKKKVFKCASCGFILNRD